MNDTKFNRNKLELAGGRILLRPYCAEDVEKIYRAVRLSLDELSPWLPFAHRDYAVKETKSWLKTLPGAWENGTAYEFGIFETETGELVGGCGINQIQQAERCANLGYWVRSDKAGQGIAVTAAKILAQWGLKALKLNRIEIRVAVGNTRSLRVAEKAGAIREGVLRNRLMLNGKTTDMVMYSLLPGEI